MITIDDWFTAYGASHQNATNKAVRWICVPLIFYSLIGLLSFVRFNFLSGILPGCNMPYAHLGALLILAALLFFIRLSVPIALGMIVVAGIILYLVMFAHVAFDRTWLFFLSIFVVSWFGQFIGHKIEGAKLSFFDDNKFLMIGPAWLLHFIYREVGIPY